MLFFITTKDSEEHVESHGVRYEVAEHVVRRAHDPYPEDVGDGKLRVWGRSPAGDYVQVIFVVRELDDVAFDQLTLPMLAAVWDEDALFVTIIHAMPMTDAMKSQYGR